MSETPTINTGLLFQPSKILELKTFFQLLKISRKDKKVDFKMVEFNQQTPNWQLNQLHEKANKILVTLNEEGLNRKIAAFKYKRNREKSGIPEDLFVQRALLRHFSEKSQSLIPYLNTVKLYHRIKNPQTDTFRLGSI